MGQQTSKYLEEVRNRKKLVIEVTTGDKAYAGTNSNAWVILEDVDGKRSEKIYLDCVVRNDLERGATDIFPQSDMEDFDEINIVEVGREDTFFGDRWLLDKITIKNKGYVSIFPIQRWIKENKVYRFAKYDCCLPNYSLDPESRRAEIEEKRHVYTYKQPISSGPVMMVTVPEEEKFHEDYADLLYQKKIKLTLGYLATRLFSGKVNSLSDFQDMFKISDAFPEPVCSKYWKEDEWFGLERVQGANPVLVSLCKELPPNLGVTSDMVEPILSMSLQDAMDQNRLFIIDLKLLDGVSHKPNQPLVAPICLLYRNSQDKLMPLAIQLNQEKGPDNPVFLPTDDVYTWTIVKMWYNMAESQHHQSVTHLGFTHLLMEGVVLCTHRTLSPSHPAYRLLAPHFINILGINQRAEAMFINPGTIMNKVSSSGNVGLQELTANAYNAFDFGTDCHIKNDLISRGVMDKDVLPYYPYRDDAVAIFDIIQDYVSTIVFHYYDTEEKLLEDEELQAWRKELAADRNAKLGVGCSGVPGSDDEGFSTREQLIITLSIIISTCSVKHAAVNFCQYDKYAFIPNYPGLIEGIPPTNKKVRTEQDIVDLIPVKSTILDIWVSTSVYSTMGTNMLGYFEKVYLYEDLCVNARERMKNRLAELGRSIKLRNKSLKHPYLYMDPTVCVPNSISI